MQVVRTGTDVCQLRIDFLDFSLAQPTGDGACTNDYFTVTGGSSPVPRICGENSGHHVYVDFSGNNPLTITVATSGSFTYNRRWHFHLQQIGCDSPSKGLSQLLKLLNKIQNDGHSSSNRMPAILDGHDWLGEQFQLRVSSKWDCQLNWSARISSNRKFGLRRVH